MATRILFRKEELPPPPEEEPAAQVGMVTKGLVPTISLPLLHTGPLTTSAIQEPDGAFRPSSVTFGDSTAGSGSNGGRLSRLGRLTGPTSRPTSRSGGGLGSRITPIGDLGLGGGGYIHPAWKTFKRFPRAESSHELVRSPSMIGSRGSMRASSPTGDEVSGLLSRSSLSRGASPPRGCSSSGRGTSPPARYSPLTTRAYNGLAHAHRHDQLFSDSMVSQTSSVPGGDDDLHLPPELDLSRRRRATERYKPAFAPVYGGNTSGYLRHKPKAHKAKFLDYVDAHKQRSAKPNPFLPATMQHPDVIARRTALAEKLAAASATRRRRSTRSSGDEVDQMRRLREATQVCAALPPPCYHTHTHTSQRLPRSCRY